MPDNVTRIKWQGISLTARPETIEDAALVILLGQRTSRSNDSVTGSEVALNTEEAECSAAN